MAFQQALRLELDLVTWAAERVRQLATGVVVLKLASQPYLLAYEFLSKKNSGSLLKMVPQMAFWPAMHQNRFRPGLHPGRPGTR